MKQPVRIKLFSALFLLTGVAAIFILLKDVGYGKHATTDSKISLDSASIQHITITLDSQTTQLNKGNRTWMVNGKFAIRPNLLQLMLVGLTKAEIKRPVSAENKNKVTALLRQKGIKVQVQGNDWQKQFLLSSNDNDPNSSYYLEEGSDEPSIIYVPGFSGDMANLFKMDEASWRSRALFISTPISLQKIAVSYPAFKSSNVEILWNADKTFRVSGVKNIDSSKVINYLAQFEQVNVDQFLYKNKTRIIDSLLKNPPQAIIEVLDLDPKGSHILSIYGECKKPKGLYAIVVPENELVLMKPETLFRLLVRKDFFEKKK
jgi:hypothetical protein